MTVNFVELTGHGAVDDMLDAENKLMAENLATKVSRLKSVSQILYIYILITVGVTQVT